MISVDKFVYAILYIINILTFNHSFGIITKEVLYGKSNYIYN